MNGEPSRKEKRENKFYSLAEKGLFDALGVFLYRSEARKLVSSGFKVVRIEDKDNKKIPLPSYVSWENAFGNDIPPMVEAYIWGEIKTFPNFSNLAQELYIIAARANQANSLSK